MFIYDRISVAFAKKKEKDAVYMNGIKDELYELLHDSKFLFGLKADACR